MFLTRIFIKIGSSLSFSRSICGIFVSVQTRGISLPSFTWEPELARNLIGIYGHAQYSTVYWRRFWPSIEHHRFHICGVYAPPRTAAFMALVEQSIELLYPFFNSALYTVNMFPSRHESQPQRRRTAALGNYSTVKPTARLLGFLEAHRSDQTVMPYRWPFFSIKD